jgi:hypothetical protein
MAEQLIKGASRRYRIDNGWLELYKTDVTKYVDIEQIAKDPTNSEYLADLNDAATLNRGVSLVQEQARASFWVNGFTVGEDRDGNTVRCVYEEDDDAYIHRRPFAAAIEHPVRVRRVYAQDTKGRDIEFLGIGKKSATGPGA